MELKVGSVCDRGLNPKRPVNQDRFLSIPERGLFAVFDGVGGQRAGEVASQTAADTIEEALAHIRDGSSPELIRRAIQFANRDIYEMAESDPSYYSMATTVALIHLDGDHATVAHVGDSRVYRLEDGRLYRETIDHTDLDDDIRAGLITGENAARQASRNIINRALGVEPDVDIEVKTISAREGARLLLCSDGIYRHLSDDEIAQMLAENEDPQRAADELKRAVLERGAEDNLTAVVVQLGRARKSRAAATGSTRPAYAAAKSVEARARPGGRIQVEVESHARADRASDESRRTAQYDKERSSPYLTQPSEQKSSMRIAIYVLMALVLVAGAFYAGLRASEYVNRPSSGQAENNGGADMLRAGREAFEKGDYQTAMTEFDSISKREPQNAKAFYWLGRAQLEQREYAKAAQSFEQVIKGQPAMHDAYVQAAAAYEAAGEKAKAAQMLSRYGEAKRKAEQPTVGGR